MISIDMAEEGTTVDRPPNHSVFKTHFQDRFSIFFVIDNKTLKARILS